MKNIIINRQSICMADDVENHMARFIVSDTCSYLGLIEEVQRAKYLPAYDIMWLLCSEKSGFIAAYYNFFDNNHIIWQYDIKKNKEICDNESFYFDCQLFKQEMWKHKEDYERLICNVKSKYNISDELFKQIEEYLLKVRSSSN